MSKFSKEIIYDNWRNFLCNNAIQKETSSLRQDNINLTIEEIRALFNYGYKFAMAQTMDALKTELRDAKDKESIDILDGLMDKTYGRVKVSDCLNIYKSYSSYDDMHFDIYNKVKDRREEINLLLSGKYGNVCSSGNGDEKM